jgi:hypothetical protein
MKAKFALPFLGIAYASLLFSGFDASATQEKVDEVTSTIVRFVNEYYLGGNDAPVERTQKKATPPAECVPDSKSCIDAACSKVSCNANSDALNIARACAGNYGGDCFSEFCSKVTCDFRSDVVQALQACRGNYSGACLKEACSHVSCNFRADLLDITNACKSVDAGCVETLCKRVACRYRADLLKVVRACGGTNLES